MKCYIYIKKADIYFTGYDEQTCKYAHVYKYKAMDINIKLWTLGVDLAFNMILIKIETLVVMYSPLTCKRLLIDCKR